MAVKNHKKINIGVFGFGHMGRAIFKLLRKSRIGRELNFFVFSLGLSKIEGAVLLNSLDRLISRSDIIFLCVKPQDFYGLKPAAASRKLFISIMAGVKTANIKKIINSPKVIRVMPNLPLQVGQGVIAWFANEKQFARKQLAFLKTLFLNFGLNFKVKQESDLDKITALTGSGPAYVFLFIDALIRAGINLGFSRAQSEQMILQLMAGSLEYYESVKNIYGLKELTRMVKSKKGTTEAALNKLNTAEFYKNWRLAVNEAYKRAKQLSNYGQK